MTEYQPRVRPMKHQHDALAAASARRAFAFFMDTRTGKTKVTIDDAGRLFLAREIGAVFVLCPNGMQRVWEDQIHEHLDETIPRRVYLWERPPSTKKLMAHYESLLAPGDVLRFLLMNIEAVGAQGGRYAAGLLRAHTTLMAIDESHRIGDPSSLQSRAAAKLGALAKYKRILTGTPDGGDPLRLFSQFSFLDERILRCNSYVAFKAEYCKLLEAGHPLVRHAAEKAARGDVKKARWLQQRIQIPARDPVTQRPVYRNLEKLHKLIEPHCFRIKKEDCFDLPEKTFNKRYCQLSKKQRNIYDLVRKEIDAEFTHGGEDININVPLAIVKLIRLAQIAGNYFAPDREPDEDKQRLVQIESSKDNPRMEALLEIIEQEADTQTVIWAHHLAEIDEIIAALTVRYGKGSVRNIDGRIDTRMRDTVRRSFQAGDLHFLVIQIRAGIGFDLFRAETVIYYTHTYSLIDRKQSEDRTDSIQRKHPIALYDIEAQGTIDTVMLECLRAKKDLSQLLHDPQTVRNILQ